MARDAGLRCVAHAGEEASCDYIKNALDILKIERIDHGVTITNDEKLIERVIKEKIPLTQCPLSNLKLKVHKHISENTIVDLLKRGVMVMINSDDPAYFGGYIGENYLVVGEHFELSVDEYKQFALNSFRSAFLDDNRKNYYCDKVEAYVKSL
mmetsp:Transcript_58809/g.49730  ORF Transcript_58809/g.49730 Transcript_58809/m.49730 type:complete len:153 (+) Transcript_58809:565-1023(+)